MTATPGFTADGRRCEVVEFAPPDTATTTIANGATTSGAVRINGRLAGFSLDAYTAGDLTFSGSFDDGESYGPVTDVVGGVRTVRTVPSAALVAGDRMILSSGDWSGLTHIKFVAATTQAALRTITVAKGGS